MQVKNEYKDLLSHCVNCRKNILQLTYNVGSAGAHIGGSLSLVEVLILLYCKYLHIDKNNLYNESRDRLILSKGHAALALYCAMFESGLITKMQLDTFKKNDSCFSAHPTIFNKGLIEFSSGSLGQGLSLGVGVGIALKKKQILNKVFVILGDGEVNEGQVWEACQAASHFKLDNLIAIIDNNQLQYDGLTVDIMNNGMLLEKFVSFGFNVYCINGHSIEEIDNCLNDIYTKQFNTPIAIIANTVKGKGVSFMENNPLWHNHLLNKEQLENAMVEVSNECY